MPYRVHLTADAERDIEDIYRYIAEHESLAIAERILKGIEQKCLGLSHFPARGNVPKELLSVGIREYRETRYKPYRIMYRIFGRTVIVYYVLDGRRDMQSLLETRLLR
jgi:toxin ParE1/3/4